ncbi:MAG: NAD(P)H-dependent oxidoreductase [Chitinophagaceae bacterium]|nr:NAD(P)H-dependent oxidoreductase [Chitinophagaceae bacterium]
MDTPLHFAGISGSLRKGSYNTMLLKAAAELLPENTTMDILPIEDLPLYNADHDLPAAQARPEIVQGFMDAIGKADALVIASPEYNYSIPGGLKNAIDWASRGEHSPLLRKPVALMGATPGMWGTVRMQLAFQAVFLFLDMKAVLKPEILIADAAKKFDASGRLLDEKAKELISHKLQNLRELVLAGKLQYH